MGNNEQNIAKSGGAEAEVAHRKWSVVRILCTMLVTLLALLLVAVAAVVIWLGPIVESVVESNDKELLGRSVAMDNLSIKLFSGELTAQNVVVCEDDDTTEFVRVDSLGTEIGVWAILDNNIHVSHVTLHKPYVSVMQGVESFNFDTLVDYILATYVGEGDEESSGEPWDIAIENIEVEGGVVAYCDESLDQEWQLSALALSTPRLYLDDNVTKVKASTTINDRGVLCGDVDVNCSTLDFVFDGELSNFNIADTYKYIKPIVNMQSIDGALSVDCRIEGNVGDILAMDVTGSVVASDFELLGHDGGNLFSTENLTITVDSLNIAKEIYHLGAVTAEGYSTQLCFEKDGTTNFDMLFYGETELSVESTAEEVSEDIYDVKERVTLSTSESEAPFKDMDLYIGSLDLRRGNVSYVDNTMHEPFRYEIKDISLHAKNVTLQDKNKVVLRAQLPKQGTAMLQWEGSLSDFYNQSLMAMLSNVDIQSLSTYVEYYTAFPVASGNLTFRSQNVVSNGQLSGVNQLGTYNFNVGQKNKDVEAEYKLPVKLGIYVLTDRNKHIDIELPISGDISSPEFSLRKVIWKAIGNVLLKVAASPFEWMSRDKQDAFRHIDIDLIAAGLDSEHYARIDSMANTLKGDTTLSVRLKPRVNYRRAVRTLSDMNLKMAYYNATEGRESGYLDMLDFARINDMKLSGDGIRQYADSMLMAQGINPVGMSAHAKAEVLYGNIVDEQLVSVMNIRNGVIARYVAFQHKDLPLERFKLDSLRIEDIRDYKGKDKYTVSLVVGDQEVEVIADDAEGENAEDSAVEAASQSDETNNLNQ